MPIKIRPKHWFECSKCLAIVGFGKKTIAKLHNTTRDSVKDKWKREGIKSTLPDSGSWQHYMNDRTKWVRDAHKKYQKYWMLNEITMHGKNEFCWYDFWRYDTALVKAGKPMSKTWSGQKKKKLSQDEKRKRRNAYKRKYRKQRAAKDPAFKIKCNLRERIRELMKTTKSGGYHGKSSLIGCSTKQLRAHLESKFTKGMTWKNYGTHWHVDHIIPCAMFNHEDENQVKQCHHWTNLQPLEASANLKKSDKINKDMQMKLVI